MAKKSITASFAAITAAFLRLSVGPEALTLDGCDLDNALPQRLIELAELQSLLLARTTTGGTRDRIWAEVALRSRSLGDEWTAAALGLAMPALRNLARQFLRDYPLLDVEDLCCDLLADFLEALASVDLSRPGIMTRLYWATYRAARKAAYNEIAADRAFSAAAAVTQPVSGHPDVVLAELVRTGVISHSDADLISAIRLDGRSLADVGEVVGASANAVLLRLRKAEMRVAVHLTSTTEVSRRRFKQLRMNGTAHIAMLEGA